MFGCRDSGACAISGTTTSSEGSGHRLQAPGFPEWIRVYGRIARSVSAGGPLKLCLSGPFTGRLSTPDLVFVARGEGS